MTPISRSKYLFYFILLFSAQNISGQVQKKLDSLLSVLKNTEDTPRVNTLNAIILALRLDDPDKSFYYLEESMALARKLNYKKGIGDAYHITGILHSNRGDYPKALENYNEALKIREEINDRNGIGTTNNNIGLVLWNQGNLENALKYYLVSLKIDEEFNEKEGMATSYNNIGIIYWNLASYDKALEYFIKAEKIYLEQSYEQGLAGVYSNIGGIYYNKKEITRALEYFQRSVNMYEKLQDKKGMSSTYSNIGEVYSENKEYDRALEYQQKALRIQEDIGDKVLMIYSFSGIGKNYLAMNKIPLAVSYLKKSVEMAIHIGAPKLRLDALKLLAEANKISGNFQLSAMYFEQYALLKDSILSEDANQKVSEMEAKFQNEMKENKIEILYKENELRVTELHREKFVRNAFITGFVLFLILSFAIYLGYRQKKKMNSLLTEKNQIIEQKNKDITDSIEYAKTLQDAILPDLASLNASLPGCFVFFRPRDIVSGDFYWYHYRNNSHFIIAADCTGHGVPGAFVSMACNNILNDVIINRGLNDPGEILTEVNTRVCQAFKKENSRNRANDGMDAALIKLTFNPLNQQNIELAFAGAMNPALVVRGTRVIEIPADKMPIGGFTKPGYCFTTRYFNPGKDDCIYIFSDGYHDQFGGPKGKKFLFRRFSDTLLKIAGLPPVTQTNELEKTLKDWQLNCERVDDILVIGVKI